ncbi:hypothetical protein BDDG_04330 [Blastomyces dermatitidis ATCC 18188]|uniref:Uncharacterized protein n=1 Tax=Ajellomyces dermatitidis (strain ATCC 18188 / CBS 674.68) TaxID=653446 RepID=F2TDS5_AJEDA|nr:hypothetical protein BDDG_04330 [Blastomyces dermatitidis ATCC 18188]
MLLNESNEVVGFPSGVNNSRGAGSRQATAIYSVPSGCIPESLGFNEAWLDLAAWQLGGFWDATAG